MEHFRDCYPKLNFNKSINNEPGLRNAQLGAIHAIASHFTLHKSDAIVVMPTGSGKTAVLMMCPYVLSSSKILIVTPSILVRGQIAEDFSSLQTLQKAGVFDALIEFPKVHELKSTYNESMFEFISNADVIIATPLCALSISQSKKAKKLFDLILIDEAHHTPARTWTQILKNFNEIKHILFTATPFRLDRKAIKGDFIYTYPLSMAYNDGIFGEIKYVPIKEGKNKDELIAKQAEITLLSDRKSGYEHYLMVRTNSKKKAIELEKIYSKKTKLNLKKIDSSMTNKTIKRYIADLKSKKIDGIICVDMLGEGFDFPNLKIAAIHDAHKSLASTLQFIGRFARTNANNIGSAKFIAMNDEELKIENRELYTNDAIWLDIIIDLTQNKARKEESLKKYFKEFKRQNLNAAYENEDIYIPSIRPNAHAKIYQVKNFNINSSFPSICNIDEESILINEKDNTVVGIGKRIYSPKWMASDQLKDITNILYIVHFQEETSLLFIYSQEKTNNIYEEIAKSFCSEFNKIPRENINRVLGQLSNYSFFNSGMYNRFSESGESYKIMAGSGVEKAMDPVDGKLYTAGHVFCKALAAKSEITIGYSSGSKIWSSSYLQIPEYIAWCNKNGTKISDPSVIVKTNSNFDFIPKFKTLKTYPKEIFFCDFNYKTYLNQPVIANSGNILLTDIHPRISEIKDNSISINFVFNNDTQCIICDINGKYHSKNKSNIKIHYGHDIISLDDYLNDNPILFRTTDNITIDGSEFSEGNKDAIVFDSNNIKSIDWSTKGGNIKIEANKTLNVSTGNSMHDALGRIILEDENIKYLFYDHGTGEMADYIAIKEDVTSIEVSLYHVKKMTASNYNSSVEDIYEISGQSIKSIIWLKNKASFLEKFYTRQKIGKCESIKGNPSILRNDINKNKQFIGKVIMVQPSIKKESAIPEKIQEIIAATNFYIKNSGTVKSFEILGS